MMVFDALSVWNTAVMTVEPGAMVVTRPPDETTATPGIDELH